MKEITIDKFGRILLPKELRDRHGLDPGTTLRIEDHGEEIRLRPIGGEPCLTENGGVLVFTGKAVGDIAGALRSHRQQRLKRLRRESR